VKSWTDPNIVDAPAGSGEVDTNKAAHVRELRSEAQKASLWVPQLDERPVAFSRMEASRPGGDNVLASFTGAGVMRSLFIAGLFEDGAIAIFVDGESTPRISGGIGELCGALPEATAPPTLLKWFGFNVDTEQGWAGCLNFPVPFRNGLVVKVTSYGSTPEGDVLYVDASASSGDAIDYGRYNFLNCAVSTASVAPLAYHNALAVSGKGKGALLGVVHALDAPFDHSFEGNHTVTADGVATEFTGFEDLFPPHSFYFHGFNYLDAANGTMDYRASQTDRVGIIYKRIADAVITAYRFFDPQFCFDSTLSFKWHHGEAVDTPPSAAASTVVAWYYTEE
jgi:hypothetical protein